MLILRHKGGDAIKDACARQHAKNGDQLTKVTRLPYAFRAETHRQ